MTETKKKSEIKRKIPDYFSRDHIVRDSKNRPLGRCVLKDNFEPYVDLKVAVLKIPKVLLESIYGVTIYINEEPYLIPETIPTIRVRATGLNHYVDTFVLKYKGEKKCMK